MTLLKNLLLIQKSPNEEQASFTLLQRVGQYVSFNHTKETNSILAFEQGFQSFLSNQQIHPS